MTARSFNAYVDIAMNRLGLDRGPAEDWARRRLDQQERRHPQLRLDDQPDTPERHDTPGRSGSQIGADDPWPEGFM